MLDLHRMNTSLLAKWLFRFYDNKEVGTWKNIIIEKYSYTGDKRVKSHLWNDILKLRSVVQGSISWQVGNGESVRFWLDRWCGESLLCIEFPNLFDIAYDKDIYIYI